MNRVLLIVVCDFLLLSLLSLARFDVEEASQQQQGPEPVPDRQQAEEDLVEVLTFALEQEQASREAVETKLAQTEEALREEERAVREKEAALAQISGALEQKATEAELLAQEKATLQERATMTEAELRELAEQYEKTSQTAQVSQERLAELREELNRRQQEAHLLQQELQEVEASRQAALQEKQQLSTQLRVTETEKQMTQEQLLAMRQEVETVRGEKARIQEQAEQLTQNVSTLADESAQLKTEIQENRPLAANTIFNEFVQNRVQTQFSASRRGFLGRSVDREMATRTILFRSNGQIYAIYHLEETPLSFGEAFHDWERLTAYMSKGWTSFALPRLAFLADDPRVAIAPITDEQANQLGVDVYELADDPYRFPEAVLIGSEEGYYGEARFQLEPSRSGYVKMDRKALGKLFGKFSPTRGDIVISKSGKLLGIMVNREYALVLDDVTGLRSVEFNRNVVNQQTGSVINQLRTRVERMPLELQ